MTDSVSSSTRRIALILLWLGAAIFVWRALGILVTGLSVGRIAGEGSVAYHIIANGFDLAWSALMALSGFLMLRRSTAAHPCLFWSTVAWGGGTVAEVLGFATIANTEGADTGWTSIFSAIVVGVSIVRGLLAIMNFVGLVHLGRDRGV